MMIIILKWVKLALAEMTVKYQLKGLTYLERKDMITNKKMAIRKIKDSFRISKTIKDNL